MEGEKRSENPFVGKFGLPSMWLMGTDHLVECYHVFTSLVFKEKGLLVLNL